MKSIVPGMVCGAVGAVVWALISASTGYEIGWIAWGIGLLVGLGVAWKTDGGPVPGGLAVVIAIVAILAGKFLAIEMMMSKEVKSAQAEMASRIDSDEEYVISWLADDIVTQMEEDGIEVKWPDEEASDAPEAKADYPADVWNKASQKWAAMSEAEKSDFKEMIRSQARRNIKDMAATYRQAGFRASFGGMDILFFLLAIATAYKVAAKSQTE